MNRYFCKIELIGDVSSLWHYCSSAAITCAGVCGTATPLPSDFHFLSIGDYKALLAMSPTLLAPKVNTSNVNSVTPWTVTCRVSSVHKFSTTKKTTEEIAISSSGSSKPGSNHVCRLLHGDSSLLTPSRLLSQQTVMYRARFHPL